MKEKESYKRNLPHIQPLGGTFFVTWNLKNAIPKSKLIELQEDYKSALKKTLNKDERIKAGKLYFKNYDKELHLSEGDHFLKDDRLAKIVSDAILFWDGKRIELYAFCIMSNHVHVVLRVYEKDETGKSLYLRNIMESIKKFSARKCNDVLNRTGEIFWQDESYDRAVRDRGELYRIISYILDNPVKAGLCVSRNDWKWSYVKEAYNEFM